MPFEPRGLCNVELEFSVLNGAMLAFTNIRQAQNACGLIAGTNRFAAGAKRSVNGKAYGIPGALRWGPGTTAGVSQIAKGFEDIPRWNLRFMARGRALATPTATKR